ncbi:pre-toxin TG domain-containing protein [Lysinibacillus xylanilyticus]|uniref:pre-toxin TG domain-containing protein n=1 Tax=Lysinibacillus xylanilyticus TaxID=582475 RepID=UPI0038174C4C
MAKKGKGRGLFFFGTLGIALSLIPIMGKVKSVLKNTKKKAKKKRKKKRKKKIGKVFTKARKLLNTLSRRRLARKFKRAVKKAVLAVKKTTKKSKKQSKTQAAVKQAKQYAKAAAKEYEKKQNAKLVSMMANYIPVVGDIKAAYEMTTGKDLITGQKLEKPKAKQTGKKIVGEAELEKYYEEYQKNRQFVSSGVNAGDPLTTLEDLQLVLGGGNHTRTSNEPSMIGQFIYSLLVEDIVTLVNPKSTTEERLLAGISMLPTSKPFKVLDAKKSTSKIIEDSRQTYTTTPNKDPNKIEITNPLSQDNIKHIQKRHNINTFLNQAKYLTDAQLENKLNNKSFFNPEWSVEEINKYSEIAYMIY